MALIRACMRYRRHKPRVSSVIITICLVIISVQILVLVSMDTSSDSQSPQGEDIKQKVPEARREDPVEDDGLPVVIGNQIQEEIKNNVPFVNDLEIVQEIPEKDPDNSVWLSPVNHRKLKHNRTSNARLSIRSPGRLGNLMFTYASLVGIATRNNFTAVLPEDNALLDVFKLSVRTTNAEELDNWFKFEEIAASIYDERTELLNFNLDIELMGYYQSWRYFDPIRTRIKREFQFQTPIKREAEHFVMESVHKYIGAGKSRSQVVLIGVHVRRGDMLEDYNKEKGYTVATEEYFSSARTYFESQYTSDVAMFIICSDDMEWTQAHVTRQILPVVYSTDFHETLDLAVLTLCDHVIISTGTFSWWAGWLSNGKVIYYRDFPEKYSELDNMFSAEDYFPSNWIGVY